MHSPLLLGLARYQATELDLQSIDSEFELVKKNVHLLLLGNSVGSQFSAFKVGLYFFLLNFEGKQFKIYLGRTESLSKRMRDYARKFQPNSPNDFKLQEFQSFVSKTIQNATIDLYFREIPKSDLTGKETEAIRHYQPLLNEIRSTVEAQQAFKEAYSLYFRSIIEQSLR